MMVPAAMHEAWGKQAVKTRSSCEETMGMGRTNPARESTRVRCRTSETSAAPPAAGLPCRCLHCVLTHRGKLSVQELHLARAWCEH